MILQNVLLWFSSLSRRQRDVFGKLESIESKAKLVCTYVSLFHCCSNVSSLKQTKLTEYISSNISRTPSPSRIKALPVCHDSLKLKFKLWSPPSLNIPSLHDNHIQIFSLVSSSASLFSRGCLRLFLRGLRGLRGYNVHNNPP
jgi:hypothetical protein